MRRSTTDGEGEGETAVEQVNVEQVQIVTVIEAQSAPPAKPPQSSGAPPPPAPPVAAPAAPPAAPPGGVKVMSIPPPALPATQPVFKSPSPSSFTAPPGQNSFPPPSQPTLIVTAKPPSQPSTTAEGYIPKVGGIREIGVHTGQPLDGTPSRPWQERYGTGRVENYTAPQPFDTIEVDATGARSWQLSRLRAMEAKGVVPVDRTGVIDNIPPTHLHKLIKQSTDAPDTGGAPSAYAPFLVSQKSKNLDFEKVLHEAKTAQPFSAPAGFKPVAAPGQFQYKMPPAKSPISHVQAPIRSPFNVPKAYLFHPPSRFKPTLQ